MKYNKKYISNTFTFVIISFWLCAIFIIIKMFITMTIDANKYGEMMRLLSERPAGKYMGKRGDILSSEGLILSSSIPRHKVYLDFLSGLKEPKKFVKSPDSISKSDSLFWVRKDTALMNNLDTICRGLVRICKVGDVQYYKDIILAGRAKKSRRCFICPGVKLNHLQYNQIRELPFFNLVKNNKTKYLVGLSSEDRNYREKPFGALARRTIGDVQEVSDSNNVCVPISGLEYFYNDKLTGKTGVQHLKRSGSAFYNHIDTLAIDGYDMVTTLNVNMQEICDKALRKKLVELNADWGVVILQEVSTGDIKAQVNLGKNNKGDYVEDRNYAISSLMEPGSTFKTASIMVALDDGVIKITDKVDTGNGIMKIYGSTLKDHNWTRGGCKVIDVPHTLMFSSNIGVGLLIDRNYSKDPQKFIDGLKRIGIIDTLNLPFSRPGKPKVRNPESRIWSPADLPWMSFGYSLQLPPIYVVNFYNAIANNGTMMQPRYVKAIQNHGEVIEEFSPQVKVQHICGDQTLREIRQALFDVVNHKDGTGKQARVRNQSFTTSGKTGTAQISQAKGGYTNGIRQHYVSFCGYFPSDAPKYTCLVGIQISGGHASGGGMAGPVFSEIADKIYAHSIQDLSTIQGRVKPVVWKSTPKSKTDKTSSLPNLKGMTARDAVYEIERRGMKAVIVGKGKVVEYEKHEGEGKRRENNVVKVILG